MARSLARLVSKDPATLDYVGEVRIADGAAIRRAVARARAAQGAWAARSVEERAAIVDRAGEILSRRAEAVSNLITREMGKPLGESLAEARNTPERIRWFARVGPAALASRREPVAGCVGVVEQRPRGVIAAIQPWNFPLNIPSWTLAPALLAGNAVVFKPSECAPLVGEALARAFHEAGVPNEILAVVHGADAAGKSLAAADVEMISFVGSQTAGRAIAREAAKTFKRIALEMGGKDPAIVLDDAWIDPVAEGIVHGAFKNCGQVCCSIERVYVARKIERRFVEALVAQTKALRIGHGLDDEIQVGPMVRKSERDRIERVVADARRRGARILCGGARPATGLRGWFTAPTILDRVAEGALARTRETFGPVLVVTPVRDEREAVECAKEGPFGLSATIWGDPGRAAQVARKIRAGTIAINRTTGSIVEHPWGGVKSSGIGRLLGVEGIREFAEVTTVRYPA